MKSMSIMEQFESYHACVLTDDYIHELYDYFIHPLMFTPSNYKRIITSPNDLRNGLLLRAWFMTQNPFRVSLKTTPEHLQSIANRMIMCSDLDLEFMTTLTDHLLKIVFAHKMCMLGVSTEVNTTL